MTTITTGAMISNDSLPMVLELDGDWCHGVLLEPFTVTWRERNAIFTIPRGFETDFASIPRFLRWYLLPLGRHAPAAVVHDWFYQTGASPRHVADECFRDLMKQLGVGWFKRQVMYRGVRLFAFMSYNTGG